jgi:hypothetical protein
MRRLFELFRCCRVYGEVLAVCADRDPVNKYQIEPWRVVVVHWGPFSLRCDHSSNYTECLTCLINFSSIRQRHGRSIGRGKTRRSNEQGARRCFTQFGVPQGIDGRFAPGSKLACWGANAGVPSKLACWGAASGANETSARWVKSLRCCAMRS